MRASLVTPRSVSVGVHAGPVGAMGEDGRMTDPEPAGPIVFAREKAKRTLPVALLVLLGLTAMYLPLPKRFVAVRAARARRRAHGAPAPLPVAAHGQGEDLAGRHARHRRDAAVDARGAGRVLRHGQRLRGVPRRCRRASPRAAAPRCGTAAARPRRALRRRPQRRTVGLGRSSAVVGVLGVRRACSSACAARSRRRSREPSTGRSSRAPATTSTVRASANSRRGGPRTRAGRGRRPRCRGR